MFGVSAHIENVSTLTLLAPPERSSATQTTGVLSAREHPPHSAHHFSRGAISALVVGGITFIVVLVGISLLMLAVDPADVQRTVDRPVLLDKEQPSEADGAADGDAPASR